MNFFDRLAILSDILQIANYEQNIAQTTNDDIMQELQQQNKNYLEEIKYMLKGIENRLESIENAKKLKKNIILMIISTTKNKEEKI